VPAGGHATAMNAGTDLQLAAREDAFSVARAKALVHDLFTPAPWVYWSDLLLSSALAYAAAVVYLRAAPGSALQAVAFLIAGLAFYRAAVFTHEIAHLRPGAVPGLAPAWDLLIGVPLLMPAFMYASHADHHSTRYYGTPADGEYLPLGAVPPGAILRYLALSPALPLLAVLRFLVLTPASLLHPRLRHAIRARASSLVISPWHRRRQGLERWPRAWLVREWAAFAWIASIAILAVRGDIALKTLVQVYVLAVFTLGLNWVRTLAAHRYRNTGGRIGHVEQMLDSVNIDGPAWLIEPLFPLGLRYHALHHLFPSLPYHALGRAHRRLREGLAADSPYHATTCTGALRTLARLWHDARASGTQGAALLDGWR